MFCSGIAGILFTVSFSSGWSSWDHVLGNPDVSTFSFLLLSLLTPLRRSFQNPPWQVKNCQLCYGSWVRKEDWLLQLPVGTIYIIFLFFSVQDLILCCAWCSQPWGSPFVFSIDYISSLLMGWEGVVGHLQTCFSNTLQLLSITPTSRSARCNHFLNFLRVLKCKLCIISASWNIRFRFHLLSIFQNFIISSPVPILKKFFKKLLI